MPRAPWTRPAILCALAAGGGPLALYLLTLSPTVNGGDSGEFITVAWVLGVAHPSGYPLHTLLAKPMTWLPLGGVAWRVGLLSALCDAGAAVLLFRVVVLLGGDLAAGLLAAGAFAFAPLIWPYAITAEVFALNNLFAAGLLYWSARALREAAAGPAASLRTLYLAALWMGLGLSNHHTLVFYAVPFALLLTALAGRRLRRARTAATLAGCAAAGFLPYLYLPLAGLRPAAVTWGDPANLSGFLTHFFRREYGTFRLADETVGTAREAEAVGRGDQVGGKGRAARLPAAQAMAVHAAERLALHHVSDRAAEAAPARPTAVGIASRRIRQHRGVDARRKRIEARKLTAHLEPRRPRGDEDVR